MQKQYFPSYNKIHGCIVKEMEEVEKNKRSRLQKKILSLTNQLNLEEEHEKIKSALLRRENSSSYNYMKNFIKVNDQGKEHLEKESESSAILISNNQESLNYCIDQDTEEENHYENHLKFKRQVLERDLFEDRACGKMHKNHDEDYIFKKLYDTTKNDSGEGEESAFKKSKALAQQPRPIYSSEAKRNLETNLGRPGGKSRNQRKYGRKQNDLLIASHSEMCMKNKKVLLDNYSRYLKDLEQTNIIKWRILNQQKPDSSGVKGNPLTQKRAKTANLRNPTDGNVRRAF